MTTRRQLLRSGALAALGLGVSGGLDAARALWTRPQRVRGRARPERVVVAVNLFGGNDALNTVVPLGQYERYRELRAIIGWDRDELIPMPGHTQDFGLNPGMRSFAPLLRAGRLAVVNGVGYPPDTQGLFDHEASQQNLQTGATYGTAPPGPPSGWLGRFLDGIAPGALPAGIDFSSAPLVLTGVTSQPLSLYSLNGFGVYPSADVDARSAAYARLQNLPALPGVSQRHQGLRRQVLALGGTLQAINDAYTVAPGVAYPATVLGGALRDCAALIAADQGVRALAVGLGGFDTHSEQNDGPPEARPYHAGLWNDVGEAVAAFHADLSAHGLGERVVSVVVSEFGRRAYENNDFGTDHGFGGIALVAGDAVKGGIYGDYPDLREQYLALDGNLDVRTDLRSMYATILARHLGADPEAVLGGDYPLLGFLG